MSASLWSRLSSIHSMRWPPRFFSHHWRHFLGLPPKSCLASRTSAASATWASAPPRPWSSSRRGTAPARPRGRLEPAGEVAAQGARGLVGPLERLAPGRLALAAIAALKPAEQGGRRRRRRDARRHAVGHRPVLDRPRHRQAVALA